MKSFAEFLREAIIQVPKNFIQDINAKLEKAGFDGVQEFRSENDAYSILYGVLSKKGLSVDPIKWEDAIAREVDKGMIRLQSTGLTASLPIMKLNEYGQKEGILIKFALNVVAEWHARHALAIAVEIAQK